MYIHMYNYACIPPTLNTHVPGMPTLEVLAMSVIVGVSEPERVWKFLLSPALNPANASMSPESSPVVHCKSAAYRNITNDSVPLVASIHWNVFV